MQTTAETLILAYRASSPVVQNRLRDKIAQELVQIIYQQAVSGVLRGVDGAIAVSALGSCFERVIASWSPAGAPLTWWAGTLVKQEVIKMRDKPIGLGPRDRVVMEDDDPFNYIGLTEIDPIALDDMRNYLTGMDDDCSQLMLAYILCHEDGVEPGISQLSQRSGLSWAQISRLCSSGELSKRIKAISL